MSFKLYHRLRPPPASRWRCCPGPVVTLVIANGLRHGTRAALTNRRRPGRVAIVIGIVRHRA